MSRIIVREHVGYRCELTTCKSRHLFSFPKPVDAPVFEQVKDLYQMVSFGWAFVLSDRPRSYCPAHAAQVLNCTCSTHPERKHLCAACNRQIAALVWNQQHIPVSIQKFLGETL